MGYPEYMVAEGTAWRFDGRLPDEHGPNDYGAPWVSRALTELRAAHQTSRGVEGEQVYAWSRSNHDVWKKKFNDPNHTATCPPRGHISIWKFTPSASTRMTSTRCATRPHQPRRMFSYTPAPLEVMRR
jgi:hypothetical protein